MLAFVHFTPRCELGNVLESVKGINWDCERNERRCLSKINDPSDLVPVKNTICTVAKTKLVPGGKRRVLGLKLPY